MTKKPRENRIPIMMSDDELKAIDDWRFENRVATRSEAVRRLCRMALTQEELRPAINDHMKSLLDATMLLADESLQERPRTPEEYAELKALALDTFSHVYGLYEKTLEQAVRLGGLGGDLELKEAIEWEKRAGDLLKDRSLFDSLRSDPEVMEALADAAAKQRNHE